MPLALRLAEVRLRLRLLRLRERIHLRLLQGYRRLPRRAKVRLIHLVAPTFTVGTICVIERADGAVLLVRHSYKRWWGFPGGLLNRGEDVVHGAHREASEELGLAIELVGEPAVVVDPRPRRVDVVFRARLDPESFGGSPMLGDERVDSRSPEVAEARWFPPDDLPQLQHEAISAMVALARQRAACGAQLSWGQGLPVEPGEGWVLGGYG